jgi:hypothetical protein
MSLKYLPIVPKYWSYNAPLSNQSFVKSLCQMHLYYKNKFSFVCL